MKTKELNKTYEDGKREMIEKAIVWLIANSGDYYGAFGQFSPHMIVDFRKAMNE